MFESAQRFAIQWRDTERALFEGLRSDKRPQRLDALRRATAHFIIARNFSRKFDVQIGRERLDPALDVFDHMRRRPLRASELEHSVMLLATRLGAAYGGRRLISAASKLLWLAHRDPAIIYDSRACRTLRAPAGNYADYLARWRAAFADSEERLRAACARVAASSKTDPALAQDVGEDWFCHRAFDVYLYDSGMPSPRDSPGRRRISPRVPGV